MTISKQIEEENQGTFDSLVAAEKEEQDVRYFKRH